MNTDPRALATVALIEEEQRRIDVYLARRMVEVPRATRVLMIGPHPDDNLFGPGGTALKYVAAGTPVTWVCVTDGRACVQKPAERAAIAVARALEDRECARRLGVGELVQLAIPEDQLTTEAAREKALARLEEELRRMRPDAVFVPYFLESHPLHRFVTHLTALALRGTAHPCQVYSWGLGSFPPPSLVVDISAGFEQKRELAACYASQLVDRDWHAELELLGRLQASYATNGAAFCELFFAQSSDAFIPDVLGRCLDRPETLAAGVQPVVPEQP